MSKPKHHFSVTFEPVAQEAAVIHGPNVRFTLLSDRLIRMEYSPDDRFEDRPSQIIWYRHQPVPDFQSRQLSDHMEIETRYLKLRYHHRAGTFTPNSLSIDLKEIDTAWSFGDHIWKAENLGGTLRTLDMTNGEVPLEPGLMARNGWAVVDDSTSLIFDDTGWLTPRDLSANMDIYFFGYGRDYQTCLQDYQKVTGRPPLIPRWALGNWWSRYWPYEQEELQTLIDDFRAHQVPLSVSILDMDWHITATDNQSVGWTGYTWNESLFPDRLAFMQRLHALGVKIALNLHPADGIYPHEKAYAHMAQALGMNPQSNEPILFDISDPDFTEAYFRLLHHPLEDEGVDFWWMDWQQGSQSNLQGLDPLWWLNHLHFLDSGRSERRRPFIFSRWGGLGNHRYPIGFSGDTKVSWDTLAFQPYFTATAANVGYGWWSHDIGGHHWGIEEGELYLRWVQWGIFSPILRLHSTCNAYSERRPWAWSAEIEQAACEAMRLRHRLIPYLYSMAYRNWQTGLPLILPLYYSHPEADQAYRCPQQYWFGTELMAAPFTAPRLPDMRLSRQRIWLPEGQWFDFFTGQHYQAGWHTIYGDLDDIPVFAKAGAIIPLCGEDAWEGVANPDELLIQIFAGADNRFDLYEDDGDTRKYEQGEYALTSLEQKWQRSALIFSIAAVKGHTTAVPQSRHYTLRVHGIIAPDAVTLTINGQTRDPEEMQYDPTRETLTMRVAAMCPTDTVTLTLTTRQPSLLATRDRRAENIRWLLRQMALDSRIKLQIDLDLPELLQGHRSLNRYDLTGAQKAALADILTQLISIKGR